MTKKQQRYWVHTEISNFRTIRNPHLVIDRETNLPVDEFTSKRAAQQTAADLNRGTT